MRTKFSEFLIRRNLLALLMVLLGSLFFEGMAEAQKKTSLRKLVVKPEAPTYRRGATAQIEVIIQDENNKIVQASKEVVVELEIRFPSRKIQKMQDTIKVGQASAKFKLLLDEIGVFDIRARHQAKNQEFLEGSIPIRVNKPLLRSRPGAGMAGLDRGFASVMKEPQIPLVPSLAGRDSLEIKFSPQRPLLADNKDSATIHVFLYADNEEGTAKTDIRVRLFNNGGKLDPTPVKISRGSDYGYAKLTSDQIGMVTVEYLGATPTVQPPDARQLQINFVPPINRVEISASPPEITLVDNADLIVRLLDEQDRPIVTDTPRLISFAIEQGRGEIKDDTLQIPKGHSDGRTSFAPTWRGQVKLLAATPNLQIAATPLTVTLPMSLLILSAIGGVAGGGIAFKVHPESTWWRILIGLVTGFVLYWAFIFIGGLTMLSRAVVLNPLSAFALSTLGGWLGTEVFTFILKRFNIVT